MEVLLENLLAYGREDVVMYKIKPDINIDTAYISSFSNLEDACKKAREMAEKHKVGVTVLQEIKRYRVERRCRVEIYEEDLP